MKTSKILLVLLLVFGQTLTQCCRCPQLLPHFDIQGIKKITHLKKTDEIYMNSMEDEEEVDSSAYGGFLMSFSHEYVAEKNHTNTGGALYACSCDDQNSVPSKERITGVAVITLNDFNGVHKAGDTINEYIHVHNHHLKSIPDFISEGEKLQLPFLSFSLLKFPTADPRFQVKVIIKLDSGEVYEATSLTVVFKG